MFRMVVQCNRLRYLVYLFFSLYIILYVSCHGGSDESTRKNSYQRLFDEEYDEEFDPRESEDEEETHMNIWTARVDPADDEVASDLAKRYGFDFLGKVGNLDGIYKFSLDMSDHVNVGQEDEQDDEHQKRDEKLTSISDSDIPKTNVRVKRHHLEHAERLLSDPMVKWVKRERILEREKRVPIESPESQYRPGHRDLNMGLPNDPQFKNEWYIKNDGQTSGPQGFDSKVSEVWIKRGLSGKGIAVSVLDDGMDHTHPDLIDNYDPYASTDLNGHDSDPFPNDSDAYNAHGTKCSGVIAAKANNSICGVGIAHMASIGAVRMLDGKATDSLEADALSFNFSHIDIYSCSWGPKDNGKTFGRPGKLGRMALEASATFGRKGKGSIFVWATGNGGQSEDDCNADGYVNSIYTLSIGSVNQYGISTYYGEKCTSTMAVTYCSGKHTAGYFEGNANADVITTYLHHQCTNHFVGTSSAAPLAAGILALVLEANKNLGWRDVQHLVVHTADLTSPFDAGWLKNGAGHRYNHKFGFGVLNAAKLVDKALQWKSVGPQHVCHFPVPIKKKCIQTNGMLKINIKTSACQKCLKKDENKSGKCKNGVTKLEHVVVTVTLKHKQRGRLSIELYSPNKTYSQLLHTRKFDDSKAGLKGWSFMTVYNWGENPAGKWTLIFKDGKSVPTNNVVVKSSKDHELVYKEMLDRRKRKYQSSKQSDESGFSSQSDGGQGAAEDPTPSVENYKTAWDEIQKKYSAVDENMVKDKFSREIDDHEGQQKFTRDVDEEEMFISKRSIADNSLDSISNESCGSDVSSSSIIGFVKSISFTFYGTSH